MNVGGHRVKMQAQTQSRFRPKLKKGMDEKPKVVEVWNSGLRSLGRQELVEFSAKCARARQTHPGKRYRRLSP